MHKIALMIILSSSLFAGFFPQTIHTTVSKVSAESISLNFSLPVKGMTGVVIHSYGNELKAISSRIIRNSSGKITPIETDIIHHDKLPNVKTPIKKGDEVIGGYLYNNVLLLAPDAKTYTKITSQHAKNWIHPDLFALFLSKTGDTAPNKDNLKAFAKTYQVGLICIVTKHSAKLLDPISGKIIGHKKLSGLPKKGKVPFFTRLKKIDSGWFSSNDTKNTYYQLMSNI